ncbi:hypothetical protein [Pseudomonas sp. Sample_24]|uniref:hypothetical protein n=1 Tax=Pseudomonas sp. Sample_24 TaxID=2448268 RepID=UPI0015B1E2AE|nr:hypothetical protein [Pseudomonas sp. Sample_24]
MKIITMLWIIALLSTMRLNVTPIKEGWLQSGYLPDDPGKSCQFSCYPSAVRFASLH